MDRLLQETLCPWVCIVKGITHHRRANSGLATQNLIHFIVKLTGFPVVASFLVSILHFLYSAFEFLDFLAPLLAYPCVAQLPSFSGDFIKITRFHLHPLSCCYIASSLHILINLAVSLSIYCALALSDLSM